MTHFSAYSQKDTAFGETVRKRVYEYMKEKDLSERANAGMISKTLLFFGLYVTIFLGLLWNPFHSLVWMFLFYGSLGIILGAIGMNIMHDKVHGAYAESPVWNFLLEIPIFLIGVEPSIWYIEHNVLHHNFTNVEGTDHDIHHRFVFRFSENQPKRWFHRFQHLYASFIYGMLLFEWFTVKDFVKVIQYRKKNLIHSDKKAFRLFVQILLKKTAFHAIFLGIPMLVINFNPGWILVAYVSMLVCGGFWMTMVFQLAHLVPDLRFIPNGQKNIEENWFIHQLQTTSNFANDNSLLTKIIGGLNFQIEHHLFPSICHVNYPQIAPIVKKTAEEYGVPYYYSPTIGSAIRAHFRLLKSLGN